jgi:hypothetical protein
MFFQGLAKHFRLDNGRSLSFTYISLDDIIIVAKENGISVWSAGKNVIRLGHYLHEKAFLESHAKIGSPIKILWSKDRVSVEVILCK